ncbi:hypothetical protein HMPREF3192_00443 [Atopobium deltae]|uniref:Uncharacterized protein n=1 Tax=Atopobium deltae TaxID=1393034 RepID=A0A133XVV4_9ACTN|nr:hypothetical protein HMPREF3192_00443 [Atopobium deltae]
MMQGVTLQGASRVTREKQYRYKSKNRRPTLCETSVFIIPCNKLQLKL